ncbi:uncharacterized protein LOC130420707 [Triplophysa dalaica]|uniref:uncharacterized protein LOC130420707 n=1 Tax=Triplophysa dalaica TaxID=1582913 RepID=UPI0024DF688A|nr:uncharacterized protein LOC130420707 [Triplophysa dalaica]
MWYRAAAHVLRLFTVRQRRESFTPGMQLRMTCLRCHLKVQHQSPPSVLSAKNMEIIGVLSAAPLQCFLKRTHRNSLHLPDKWNNAYYEPSTLRLFLYLPEGHGTHAFYTKDMKVIVSTGRLCTVTVNMCACEPETCTLLRYGLWPATADKHQTAFSIPLLELFVCLSLECPVSVEGFCNTLRWKNNLTLAEVNALYRALVGESISHFRHHHFRKISLVDVCPQLGDGTTCPACPKADGDVI